MKQRFFVLAICAALVACGEPAHADWSVAYDLRTHEAVPVLAHTLSTQHNVLGFKGFDVDVQALAGVGADHLSPTVGVGFTHPWKVSAETTIDVGFWGRLRQGEPAHGGFYVGLRF